MPTNHAKRAFKYRFYPTDVQAAELSRTFGCVRKVYNMALAARTAAWARQERVNYNATSAMLTLLERCFPDRIDGWRPLLQEAIPSYGHKLSEEPALLADVFADTTRTLELHS